MRMSATKPLCVELERCTLSRSGVSWESSKRTQDQAAQSPCEVYRRCRILRRRPPNGPEHRYGALAEASRETSVASFEILRYQEYRRFGSVDDHRSILSGDKARDQAALFLLMSYKREKHRSDS